MTISLKNVQPFLFLSALFCFVNCNAEKERNTWSESVIDPDIPKNAAFTTLDQQPEIFSVLEEQDLLAKKSSAAVYYIGDSINPQDYPYTSRNNCRAYFFGPDTLIINIGFGTGFGGAGFIINYKGRQFYTEPYFETDVIIEGEPVSTYKVVSQKLVLDKSNYKAGDSLYGFIDFKSIETTPDKKTRPHNGKGFFRAVVKGQL